jgi:hypothetical protein
MKTSIISKSNLGLLFVGLFISGFILLNSTDSTAGSSVVCEPSNHNCTVKTAYGKVITVKGIGRLINTPK